MTSPALPDLRELDSCLLADREPLRRRIHGLRKLQNEQKPFDQGLAKLLEQLARSQAIAAQRRDGMPRPEFPPELPISERREEIAALIAKHQVIVLCGETGSGKSTQLPKICLQLGRGIFGRIGHTQPRRIAARSLAVRLSQELGRELGGTVGYKVRFHDQVRPESAVKLLTDGMLLAEMQRDRMLLEYDTLIIDEAHERSLNIDFLLGYLRQLLPKRPDLKIVITSATIDPDRFSRHFDGAPVLNVSGRTYPVEVRYRPVGLTPSPLVGEGRGGGTSTREFLQQESNPDSTPPSPTLPHKGGGSRAETAEQETFSERDEEMQRAIIDAVDELGRIDRGDILIFLSGEREIRETAESLRKHRLQLTEVLPLYARQSVAEQSRIFQPGGQRRIVLATNVAETSLTVPGIRYVIDTGFARISRYSHRSKVQRLPVERVSQASADQRKGRCGRVAAGVCIRLYSEEDFLARRDYTEPEILRTNLAAVILQMETLGVGRIEAFPFVDPPDPRLIKDGYRILEEIGAVLGRKITTLGQKLARLPVDPRIARMLLEAAHTHCLGEVLPIAAALSVQDPKDRPIDKQQQADEAHRLFRHPESDFLGQLKLWHELEEKRRHLSTRKFREFCRDHFLSWTRVQEWHDIHQQLRLLMHEMGYTEGDGSSLPSSKGAGGEGRRGRNGARGQSEARSAPSPLVGEGWGGGNSNGISSIKQQIPNRTPPTPAPPPQGGRGESAIPTDQDLSHHSQRIHKALLTGLLSHIGFREGNGKEYQGARASRFYIFPGSALFESAPKWVAAAELVETTRLYARTVGAIQPEWVEAVAGHLLKRTYSEPHWEKGRGQVAAYERVTLFGLVIAARRKINYGPIEPVESREIFIRHGLVDGDFETRAPFWRHNQQLIDEVRYLEEKSRRQDLLIDEQARYDWYARRIPDGIYSTPQFEQWLRDAVRTQPKLLHMRMEDLLQRTESPQPDLFPDALDVHGMRLPLLYRFQPGEAEDGVTLRIPQAVLNQVSEERAQWLVPGLLRERVIALMRGLPKNLRKSFVPIPDVADACLKALQPSDKPLTRALGEQLKALTGVHVPEDAWDESTVPDHLKMHFQVLDEKGQPIDAGADLVGLKKKHGDSGGAGYHQLPSKGMEREGITSWDFGPLPELVELTQVDAPKGASKSPSPSGRGVGVRASEPETRAKPAAGAGSLKDLGNLKKALASEPSPPPPPPKVEPKSNDAITLIGYPALVDQGQSVALRVLDSRQNAERATHAGLRRLIMLALPQEMRYLRKNLPGLTQMRLQYAKTPATPEGLDAPEKPDLEGELVALIVDLTFLDGGEPLRDANAFTRRIAERKPQLMTQAHQALKLTGEILDLYQQARQRLTASKKPAWLGSVKDIQQQLDRLVFQGFLRNTDPAQLRHLPRYLKGILLRLEKLPLNPARDRQWMEELEVYYTQWQAKDAKARHDRKSDERLEELRWMFEELRISLFAQELKTAYPVSVKRVEKRWREMGL